ncbi:MAG: hypothetical protein FWC20_10820 [Oscillospiraceae bacterium]|nr:hypothetical protein [Oscillospiraceae bacterium]MCL2279878.1 hypothetical protein [Oscillospiraceae bacterium]
MQNTYKRDEPISNISELEQIVRTLPLYLQKDIRALEEGEANNVSYIDCLINEVQGSINSALWGREISEETADKLWEHYV